MNVAFFLGQNGAESLHLIRLTENKPVSRKQKLSERFTDCQTTERADELQTEIIQMRKEFYTFEEL